MTPKCSRCEFDIVTARIKRSTQPMLEVRLVDTDVRYWVCGHCHAPREEILTLVRG